MDEIDFYIKEDLGEEGDITSNAIFTNETGRAVIVANENCIVAGLEEAKEVFDRIGAKFEAKCKDGENVRKGEVVAEVHGKIRCILAGERLALNIISRMSGIATETRELLDICRKKNPNVNIAATRKTTPGFRKYEKKAVELGGGESHRFGLYDAVLIKDNHIKAVGSVREAIRRVKGRIKNKFVEVEVESVRDAIVAAEEGVDAILIDNATPETAQRIASEIRKINPKILIEISGGIRKDNIAKYAPFANRISLGYITHSIRSRDFSLEIII